jgi:hypothetical protein
MLSPEKAAQLRIFLGSLSGHIAARLAKAVEVDRLTGGASLPHDFILDGLRPALRNVRGMERTPSPLRIFCQPFADLLVNNPPRRLKRRGRIARESVLPIWNWLSQTLIPDVTKSYAAAVTEAVIGYRPDEMKTRSNEFWADASAALHVAISGNPKEAQRALGSDPIVADAEEIAILLGAGPEIAAVQEKVPRGTHQLTDDMVWALRGIYDRLVQSEPDAAPYIAVVTMNRLERPWEALKLPQQVTRQTSDTLMSSTDMGLAGEVLLGDLDEHTAAIKNTRHPNFDADELSAHVAAFARLSNGLAHQVELRRQGVWHQRLMKDRGAVSDVMEGLMERAPREIVAMLPVHKTGSYGGGPKAPDISRTPDPDKTARGTRYAKLLAACGASAGDASFGTAQKDAYAEATLHLKGYTEDILREVRAAEGQTRANAEQYFNLAVMLTETFFTAEEADFLRRRGRAALADAA